jgi:hypothetical protein
MSQQIPSNVRKIAAGAACLLLGAAAAVWFSGPVYAEKAAPSTHVFELRTYHCMPGKLEALKARFRQHTIRIFERHGMKSIGYWIPADAPASENTLTYILEHESREAAQKSWNDFRTDPEWVKVREASEKDGKIVEKVDSTFLNATDFSPLK